MACRRYSCMMRIAGLHRPGAALLRNRELVTPAMPRGQACLGAGRGAGLLEPWARTCSPGCCTGTGARGSSRRGLSLYKRQLRPGRRVFSPPVVLQGCRACLTATWPCPRSGGRRGSHCLVALLSFFSRVASASYPAATTLLPLSSLRHNLLLSIARLRQAAESFGLSRT